MPYARPAIASWVLGAIVGSFIVCPAYAQTTSTWTGLAGDGLWTTPGNWSGGVAPGTSPGDTATFNAASTPSLNGQVITVGTPITLGSLTTAGTGAATFTISGSTITFDTSGGTAQLQFGGNNLVTLSSALALNRDLAVIGPTASAQLTISGAVTGAGRKLTNSGVGALFFSGGGKTFDGGFDIFAGKVETTLASAGGATLTLGALDAATNYLGAGNLTAGNNATELVIKSAGGSFANQSVALNGSTLKAEFGATLRFSEQDSRNGFTLNLNSGTLDGGTNVARGTLYLAGTDLAFNANGTGGSAIANTPNLVFDTSTNTTAMKVTLNGGTLTGFGNVRKTGANVLNFADAGTFGAAQFSLEAGRTNFGLASLNLTTGLLFSDLTAQTSLLTPTGVAAFGKASQMAPGGNDLNAAASATGSLLLGGFDQTFGTVTLGANAKFNVYLQPASPAAPPVSLAIGTLTSAGPRLSIHGWRGNPQSHALDGTATTTDSVTVGAGSLANVWFRGYDPGAVVGTGGVLRPVDFLHTTWTGGAGPFSGTINFRWFDLANWSVDAPNHAGAVVTFGALAGSVVTNAESQPVTIGHLVTNSTGKLQIGSGTLILDSGVTGAPSTLTGTGSVVFGASLELRSDLTINTGAASTVTALTGTGDIAINGGGLNLSNANPAYDGDVTLNAGRLTFGNADGLGPVTNTLRLAGGEVYAGNNSVNAKTISNRVEFIGDFTAGYIEFGYAGDVSWTGTRTITGDGTVGFGENLRLTGPGALVVQGGSNSGLFAFKNDDNDFSGGLTILPRLGYGSGSASVALRGELVTGATAPGKNYLGTGPITARANLEIATGGFATTMNGALTLGNGADLVLTGGGALTLASTATLTREDATGTDLVTDGNLAINGAALVNKPNIVSNPDQGTTKTITSTGSITGVGTFSKTLGGATILDAPLAADEYRASGGILVLNRNSVVNSSTAKMFISGASIHAEGTGATLAAPNTNRFGVLQLDGSASIFVEDHTAITFTSGTWTTAVGRQLLLQNATGVWSTAADPALSDAYVRFTSATGLSPARLAEVAFTGFAQGASLVPQNVGGTNYWFLAPTGQALTEWSGGSQTERLWSTGTNWLTGVSPNGAGALVAVRGLDRFLPNNVIIVDSPVTLGQLFIERGPSTFDITSQTGGSITFDNAGAGALISVANDNQAVLSSNLTLLATDPLALRHLGTQIFTLSGRIGGAGGIVSNYAGPGTSTLPDAGIIRFAGNVGTSDYTGGFWLRGAPGNNVALDRGAREIRIATDGTLFGTGINTGDPATSTQALRIGDSSAAGGNAAGWYRIIGEGGAHTVNASVRFDGNLLHSAVGGLTFQSTASSYVTAGLKQLSGTTTLNLNTPIAGPGGFQFGGSNQTVNFNGANTFTGGITFLTSYSPVIGLGADNALGTGTVTYDTINVGNSPSLTALGGARTLSNQFVFKSPVGTAKITGGFDGDITLDRNGRSQLINSPGLVVSTGSTLTFTATHILEGTAGLIKNGLGTLRLLAANEYAGDTDLVQGTLQVGHNLALGPTGVLLFSDATKVGTLASFGGARILANRVAFNAPTFGLDGTAGRLTLNPNAANGATTLAAARTANVTGPVTFGSDLRLTGAGSFTKAGDGTLTFNSGGSTYTGGTNVTRGVLQVLSTGNVTVGRTQAGQNPLGTGAVTVRSTSANPGIETTVELVVPDGASVSFGGNLEVTGFNSLGGAGINVTSTAGAVTGTAIKTYLDATQTISGNSFGTLRTGGDLIKTGAGTTTTVTGDVFDTPNLVIDSGTLNLAAGGIVSRVDHLTMGNGTLRMNSNQTLATGSTLNLTGNGTVDMGSNGFLTFGSVGSWNPAGSLSITNWNGITLTGGGTSQFRFTSDVTALFTDAMLSSIIITGGPGTLYAPGAMIARNVSGFYELLPAGAGAEWDHGGSGYNWTTAQNWNPDTQPTGAGSAAIIGNLDAALNGKTITVDSASISLGSLVINNTNGAAFTVGGNALTLQQSSTTANAVLAITGNSSPTIASNLVLANNLLVTQQGTGTVTLSGVISGTDRALIKDGTRTLALTGANTYSGGTRLIAGTLLVGADNNLGAATGGVTFDGGGLRLGSAFDLASTRALTLTSRGGTFDNGGFNSRIAQAISGTGNLTATGAGTLTLTGDNTYTGTTLLLGGTVQLGNGGTSGSLAGNILDNGALIFNRSDSPTYNGVITGTGTLSQAGTGTLTFTGNNTYTGTTTIASGTLQLGDGGTSGSVAGSIVDNGALAFNRSDDLTYGNVISGSGTLAKLGAGELKLTGASTYTGTTAVDGGTLLVNGSLATSALSAAAGTTFGGRGSVAGDVTIANGAHLSPGDGNTTGVLTLGSLVLNGTSELDYHFGTPNVVNGAFNDRVDVTGDLTLAGQLNVYDLGGFGQGVYRLFNYAGTLTDNGLTLGATFPAGFNPIDFTVQTSPGQVNLVVSVGGLLNQFWDGPPTAANNLIDGGTGTWTLGANNWTNADGNANALWAQFGFAIFTGTAGTVTLGDTVQAGGLQFITDGYQLTAGATTHTIQAEPNFIVRVGTGATATVAAPLVDATTAAKLTKTDLGTLVLSGANTYSGGTQVNGGTLQIASDANLGAAAGALGLNDGTLRTTANLTTARAVTLGANGGSFQTDAGTILTLTSAVTGAGDLTKQGTGTLVLANNNTYTGDTAIAAGTLQVGNGNAIGSITGDIDVDAAGTLAFFRSDSSLVVTNAITGDGTVRFRGTNVSNQSSYKADAVNSTFTGLTIVESGARLIMEGASLVDSAGTQVESGGTLYLTDGATYHNDISLTGTGWQENSGRLGALRLGDATTVSGTITLAGDARIGILNSTATISGVIAEGGLDRALEKAGDGTLKLTGNNTYTGGTTISDGTLQLGNGGTTGSVMGDITDNAALVFNRSDTLTYAGAVSGTGSLIQAGTGTLVLTGTNTYTGGTTISAGTLQLGAGGATGSVAGNITDNAALVFNRSDILTYGGVISGSGSLAQAGAGTTILTNTNTYGGGTTISAGTLQLGNGGTTGSVTGDIVDNSALVFNRSDTVTFGQLVSGTGTLEQAGTGTLILTNTNTYGGGTFLSSGILQVSADGNLGAVTGPIVFNGVSTLRFGAAFDPAATRAVTLTGGNTGTIDTNGFDVTLGSTVAGAGSLVKTGAGTLTFTADNNYTGGTTVTTGTLQLGIGGTTGSVTGPVTVNDTLIYFRSDAGLVLNNSFAGSGTVRFRGTGVSGESDYRLAGVGTGFGGSVIVEAGARLQLTDPGQLGAAGITVQDSGSLFLTNGGTYTNALSLEGLGWLESGGRLGALRLSDASTLAGSVTLNNNARFTTAAPGDSGTISGAIDDDANDYGIEKTGAGLLILSGASTYTGGTAVSAGTLQVNGSLATATLSVANGATLGGIGSIAGTVTVTSGGHLAPGTSPGTITTGTLVLQPGAILDYELNGTGMRGGPVNDLTNVNGDLTLNGTINISSTLPGGLTLGIYRLINYTGTWDNPGGTLLLGTVPAANDPGRLFIQTSIAQQVNLVHTAGFHLDIWDGGNSALHTNGAIDGGDGIWDNTNVNWTGITGATNGQWTDHGHAIFAATPGTVTVDHSAGAVNLSGAQFASDGYVITGQSLTTTNAATVIRVGDGTDPGATFTATIEAEIAGTGGLEKTDGGTLILAGINTYTGGTTISGGTLQIGNGGATGSIVGDILDNSVLAFNRSDVATYAGRISGTGALIQAGTGTLVLTGENSHTGGTAINAGTLQIGDGGTTGSIAGVIIDDSALVFNRSDTVTYAGAISGFGTLTQAGSGTLVLTGDNTHTGGSTVATGVLQIGNGGITGSVAGNIAIQTSLVFNRSDGFGYNGSASGPGSLTQAGTGTLALFGTNGHAGGTYFNAGAIQASADTNLGAIAGLLSFDTGTLRLAASFDVDPARAVLLNTGGGTLDTNGFNSTLGGATSGPGRLTKIGAGTLVLAAANAHTGGTAINGGVVQASTDRNLGAAGGSLSFDGATLRLGAAFDISPARAVTLNAGGGAIDTNGFNATLAGVVGGPGALFKLGAGTLTVSGANTYGGGTAINGGTLAAFADTNLGAAGTAVAFSGGTLEHLAAFNTNRPLLLAALGGNIDTHGFDVTYSGSVAGTGILNKTGPGTLTFTNVRNISAGTMVSEGIMRIGDGGTTGTIAAPIVNNSVLIFDRADDFLTYAGAVSGTGAFIKRGPGILTFTGTSTATGLATIENGTLRVNGTIASPVLVTSHGTLSGTGSVGATINEGRISPGNSIGTLTINGDYLNRASGVVQGEGNPSGAGDRIVVNGAATLEGGMIDLRPEPGVYLAPLRYLLVDTTGGVTGKYTGILQEFAFFDVHLEYTPNQVFVVVDSLEIDNPDIAAISFNTDSVAGALDDIRPGADGDLLEVIEIISVFPTDEAARALNSLTGEIHPTATGLMQEGHALFGQSITRRLSEVRGVQGSSAWVRPYGVRGDLDSDGNGPGAGYKLSGLAAGADRASAFGAVFGASFNYSELDIDSNRYQDHADGRAYDAALYGSHAGERWYWDGVLSYAWLETTTRRQIEVGDAYRRTAAAQYDGRRLAAYFETGRRAGPDRSWLLEPVATLQYTSLRQDGFAESGAGDVGLRSAAFTNESLRSGLGGRLGFTLADSDRRRLTPELRVRWVHEFLEEYSDYEPAFLGAPGRPFEIRGTAVDRDSLSAGVGVRLETARHLSFNLDYDIRFNADIVVQNFTAGVRYAW